MKGKNEIKGNEVLWREKLRLPSFDFESLFPFLIYFSFLGGLEVSMRLLMNFYIKKGKRKSSRERERLVCELVREKIE